MEWWNILPPQIWNSVSVIIDVIAITAGIAYIVKFFVKERIEKEEDQ